MMERLRAGADSLVVKIILSLIILSFLFAGVGSYLVGGSETSVAVVGNVEITQPQFEQAYQAERQRMQDQVGEVFNTMIADPSYLAQFRANVLERMVNQSLLDQYATSLGLRVSDESVKNEIRNMPAFFSNGIFNNDQYLAALRRNGLAPEQFAEFVRQDLVRSQLIEAVQSSEFTLENELTDLYKLEEQTRTVRSLTLPIDKFVQDVQLTQEQKEAYYKEHSMQFMRPEQFKIAYIELSGDKLAEKITISEDEAQTYYQANLARYGSNEKRKVSHIMLEGTSEEQKQQAQSILDEIKAGGDFASIAKERSQDKFSAEQGGQLDWFEKGVMDPAFEEAAFALLNKGEIFEQVVKSDFGFHIIKLDDIDPSNTRPFAEVKEEIQKQLKQQKAAETFYDLSTTLAEKAFEMPDDLEEASKAVDIKVTQTDFVALSELQGTLAHTLVRRELEQSEVRDGLNSELIEIAPEHVVVVRIDETRPEMLLPFAEVETTVTTRLQSEKARENMLTLAKTLVQELKENKDETLKASGYHFSAEKVIKRVDENRDLSDLAFSLSAPEKGSNYSYTQTLPGDLLVVALDAINEPSLQGVDLKAKMAERVKQSFATADLLSLVDQLKQEIKITNNLASIDSSFE